jgi:hypothetical protein
MLNPKILISCLFRLVLPFFIFVSPLLTLFISLIVDNIDGQLFYDAGFRWKTYNKVDKFLDYWWYIFILIYFYVYLPQLFLVALILFVIRTVGQVLGVYLQIEKIYIFFPNILEWFFMLSILLPNQKLEYNLIIATGISLFVEYIIHINNFHLISKYIHHREIIWAKNEPKKKSKSIKK